jgi:hypothetical protein
MNTLTAERALQHLSNITEERRRALVQVCNEPAIARVVVLNDVGTEETYFIARATASSTSASGAVVVNYRAPVGRLAASPVGSDVEIRTPRGIRVFEVLERATLRPLPVSEDWDSINSRVEGVDY